ncbi:MAG: efflux RND transporter periplasmic adaptor subunit [Hyphomicrobiales bacterium]|nr:efflux RND transporter periplasmic adaptor subunit [Hyphomicrobiales bacterium]
MSNRSTWIGVGLAVLLAGAATLKLHPELVNRPKLGHVSQNDAKSAQQAKDDLIPAVSVESAKTADFVDSLMVNGTLLPREEVLVGAQIDGLQITELDADQGDIVHKGQVLARLSTDNLQAQLAQNDAALARANAAIAQTQSQIAQMQANVTQTAADFKRINELRHSPAFAQSTFDQRQAQANSASAQLSASQNALLAAKADLTSQQAQRKQLEIKLAQAQITAPSDGIISQRNAQVGAIASAAGGPLFRIIRDGAIELDGEVSEQDIPRLRVGMIAQITPLGSAPVQGKVRLISPDIDMASRLGHVRISVDAPAGNAVLRPGTFAQAVIVLAQSRGTSVPSTAVTLDENSASLLIVKDNKVVRRKVVVGVTNDAKTQILQGVADGEVVIVKAAGFLRDGDLVRPMTLPSGDAS